MRIVLTLENLAHRKIRTLVSIIGVSFPVMLIFIHLGLYEALMRTATLFYDQLSFDLAVVSKDYYYFSKPSSFPRNRIYQALGEQQVKSSKPFYIGYQLWKNPQNNESRELLLIGVDPRNQPFSRAELQSQAQLLTRPDTLLFDQLSRPEYGTVSPGTHTQIGANKVEVVDVYSLGTGFAALGAGIVSDQTLSKIMGGSPLDQINVGLIELQAGSDASVEAKKLALKLPSDVMVLTREELNSFEERYWTTATSVGVVLSFGLLVSLIVGTIILYQLLFTDISNRLHEFAILQAIGYTPFFVTRVVLEQTTILCLAGFFPGLLMALLLYRATVAATNLPVEMTAERVVWVLVGLALIGSLAGLLSVRRAKTADPADLFQ